MNVDRSSEGVIFCNEPVLTQQSAKDECDINLIVETAKRGADISHLSSAAPMYGDFTGLPSYRESLLMINKARDLFMSLDARVRERFANDPARLLDFLNDPANFDEAVKLGLVKAPAPAEPAVPPEEAPDEPEFPTRAQSGVSPKPPPAPTKGRV